MGPTVAFELKVREQKQTRLLKNLNKANFWSKFHQNRPTHIFDLWNTFLYTYTYCVALFHL